MISHLSCTVSHMFLCKVVYVWMKQLMIHCDWYPFEPSAKNSLLYEAIYVFKSLCGVFSICSHSHTYYISFYLCATYFNEVTHIMLLVNFAGYTVIGIPEEAFTRGGGEWNPFVQYRPTMFIIFQGKGNQFGFQFSWSFFDKICSRSY